MANTLRILLFVLLAGWAVFCTVNLQFKPIPGYFHGGLYQFTTQNSRGWPRSDALTQRIHSVQSESSVFGALKYDRTVTNKWRTGSLVVNAVSSIVLLAAISCFVWKIIFASAHFRFPISTAMLSVAAVAVSLTVFINERELHALAFQNHNPLLPDFYARTLGNLGWNNRVFVIAGVCLTTFLFARYAAKGLSKLFVWFSPSLTST